MGISDDIKPVRHSGHHHSPANHTVEADPVVHFSVSDEKDEVDQHSKDDIRNSFFEHPDPVEDEDKVKSKAHWSTWIFNRWILLLVILTLGFALAFQNISSLKNLILGKETAKKTATSQPAKSIVSSNDYTSTPLDTATSAATTPATTTPTVAAPVAAPTIDKAAAKVQVLNGNGTTGSASTVKTTLQTAGFTVSSLTNAKRFTYTQTYIYFKTGQDAIANLVKAALPSRTTVLQNDDTVCAKYDIVVVVGKK